MGYWLCHDGGRRIYCMVKKEKKVLIHSHAQNSYTLRCIHDAHSRYRANTFYVCELPSLIPGLISPYTVRKERLECGSEDATLITLNSRN